MKSLWGEEFTVEKTPEKAKKIIKKLDNKNISEIKKIPKSKNSSVSLTERLSLIKSEVLRILGVYKENTKVIYTREDLHKYIDKCISNGVISIDTETNNSLQPVSCKIMGGCIYTPGEKNIYIPINHIDPVTKERLTNQCTEQDLKEEFSRLTNTHIIMHHGKFDYEVIKCTCDIALSIYWDTMIAARLLNENEKASLKEQYITKIDPSIEKYSIEHLFKDVEYAVVDPELFALYAATDAFMTYKLYEWQVSKMNLPENSKIKNLFFNIEMPIVTISAEMELEGMSIDIPYSERLSKKYHKLVDEVQNKIDIELQNLSNTISEWRKTEEANFHPKSKKPNKNGEYTYQKSKNEQLSDPPELTSPTQFAILLYDILKCPVVDKKSPRGTGEDIIKKLDYPICKLILELRGLQKLIGTYIDKLPECVDSKDNRLHASFNQLGTDTGRFSSSDPNLQNIPSKSKNIRLMFCAKEGYRIIGADYSAQEPRLTAFYSNDPEMIKAYDENKDLYAVIASLSFDQPYEDCLEFYPVGTEIEFEGKKVICGNKTHLNPEGKHRRTLAKSILLGLLYGRGAKSVGEQIGKTKEEAQEIIDKFFKSFPSVKIWIDKTMENARKYGYVEDIVGRRRRLPDILLPQFTVTDLSIKSVNNPILGSKGLYSNKVNPKVDKYLKELKEAKGLQQVNKIKESAKLDNIEVKNNGGLISQAERQAVNSRVQGGAATLTKLALIKIYNDKRLRDIGANLINTVHDEILMEVPKEYVEEGQQYLAEDMINSAKDVVNTVPMKVDTYCVKNWYFDEETAVIEKEFKEILENSCNDKLKAFTILKEKYTEFTDEQLNSMLENYLKD